MIPLTEFDICWGVNPEKCPPNLYIIVAADLQSLTVQTVTIDGVVQEVEVWEDIPETVYA